jgi:beta-N-acetylhexosaminidase
VVISDDLSMEALKGDLASRATACLAAGCDLVLHCTGTFAEMQQIAPVLSPLSPLVAERLRRGREMALKPGAPADRTALQARLDQLLLGAAPGTRA